MPGPSSTHGRNARVAAIDSTGSRPAQGSEAGAQRCHRQRQADLVVLRERDVDPVGPRPFDDVRLAIETSSVRLPANVLAIAGGTRNGMGFCPHARAISISTGVNTRHVVSLTNTGASRPAAKTTVTNSAIGLSCAPTMRRATRLDPMIALRTDWERGTSSNGASVRRPARRPQRPFRPANGATTRMVCR